MSVTGRRYFVDIGDGCKEIEVESERIRIDGEWLEADISTLPGTDRQHLRLDGRSLSLFARRRADGWLIELEGREFLIRVEDERRRRIRELASHAMPVDSPRELRAPMPGLIVSIDVATGESVEPGQGLVVMEAMKMENELRADRAGTVVSIEVSPGQAVDRDALLLRLE